MATKQPRRPQYRPSLINVPAYDYGVYHFSFVERLAYAALAAVVAGFVGYLFFGGLAQVDGEPTTATHVLDAIVIVVPAFFGARAFLRIRAEQLRRAKLQVLQTQFRDMLDSLVGSLSAGGTVIQGFQLARDDLERQHSPNAPIVQELNLLIAGFHNNIRIEDMLHDLGERSAHPDIESFANVFKIAYLRGADMKLAVTNCHQVLSEKMQIGADIETGLAASKNEAFIMVVIPVILVALLKSGGGTFAEGLRSPVGVLCTAVAVAMFIGAFALARRIMTIRI
ncbi:type II secretion system protein F (GspF) [Flavimobilis soli]|uniref:Type II secretion system protein F (GspF) n=1 Tax=Flavimobilis soli TaxID=442709 RepID=A0A2A9ECP2_9MICO|nr:hypothetical protein [Flavimobilis soli]PFG36386.1 type II secretion system protein F (GspF) [Flavimobilis soli]